MAISIVLTAAVLFGLRDVTLAAMHRVEVATATSSAGRVQVAIGLLALLIAAVAVGLSPRQRLGRGATAATQSAISGVSMRAHRALQARPLGVAFALGVGMLVDFRFMAALTAIVASGAAAGVQIGAAGVYTVIALAFVELPLASQLAAPAKTDQVMSTVNRWAKTRRQEVFAVVIALLGVFLLTRGLGRI